MPTISCQAYTFDPRPNYPLLITAKRYWRPSSSPVDPTAVTLVFTHGTGFHKEHWEPSIDELYSLFDEDIEKIKEVWSIDAPNHGDAAILNEETLRLYLPTFSWEEYARSIHAFLAGLGTGVDVDFSTRRLVAIGHSMGASSFVLSTAYHPPIKYSSMILVEPMILKPSLMKGPHRLEQDAIKRRDIWPSREEAYSTLKSRPTFQAWDDRVLKIFVEHGLRSLPTIDHPDQFDGVTLKCTKYQEAACFRDGVGSTRAYGLLPTVLKRMPVHIMYCSIDDAMRREIKEAVLNHGWIQNFASVTWIEGAGHLVVQAKPRLLAEKIREALLTPTMRALL